MLRTLSTAFFCFGLLAACSTAPPEPVSSPRQATTLAVTQAPPPSAAAAPIDASAPQAPAASASATASAEPAESDAGAAAPVDAGAEPVDWKNLQPFTLSSAELTERAKGLFEAIAKDDPSLAEPFWFPKEPFIPLKDVKGPGKYWENLHTTYVDDIHALHRKRKSWDDATFVSFTVGSKPKWVKPGDEANKIGYYRSFRGTLAFTVDGKPEEMEVHTIITWQGRWYITHLRKFKH
jgi:hypothetical protein